jgi:MFS family permease
VGFGLSGFEAGLVIVPFSLLGFMSGRIMAHFLGRVAPYILLLGNGLIILGACVLFALERGELGFIVLSMGLLGAGVGGFWAVIPTAVLSVTPSSETSSAMAVNQLFRSAGFSIGSAVTALVLALQTTGHSKFPRDSGYATAGWVGAGIVIVSLTLVWAGGRFSTPEAVPTGISVRHQGPP